MSTLNTISASYLSAANVLRGKNHRNRIVAYVESYDDVLFWRTLLSDYEDETRYFEVMLPTRRTLTKGKKQAIMQMLRDGAGESMISCVDADYDYLLQGATASSLTVINNPYVFHTYAYSIENHQCYAPSLHNVCVMATLNDHPIFDFVGFFTEFSRIIFPLFVWNIWFYRHNDTHTFSINDFNHIVTIGNFNIHHPEDAIEHLRHKVTVKLNNLRHIPNSARQIEALTQELIELGVTPETTYLYIQGHHLFDTIVLPILDKVCKSLRYERETEIRHKANHALQRQNELSAYANAQTDITQMLKKNTGCTRSVPYKRLIADVENFLSPKS